MVCEKYYVVSIRANGKILRDNNNVVTLPFGSEYQILIKNLRSRRAMAKISVDGVDITDGTRLVLQPNASMNVERFIKNGDLLSGNRLKFIERTERVETHRGIKEDDGLVRVEFWQEREVVDVPVVRHHYYDEWYAIPRPYYPLYLRPWHEPRLIWNSGGSGVIYGGAQGAASMPGNTVTTTSGGEATNASFTSSGNFQKCAQPPESAQQMFAMNMMRCDAGITVPGSESRQQFHHASGFQLESNSTVIVLRLRGEVGGVAVAEAVTVERKPVCSTCGKKNSVTSRFCDQCATALQLV